VLNADAKAVLNQLNQELKQNPFKITNDHPWWKELQGKINANVTSTNELMFSSKVPMTYYNSLYLV